VVIMTNLGAWAPYERDPRRQAAHDAYVRNDYTQSGAFALAATSQQNIDELPYTGFDTVTSPTVTIAPGATATIPGTLTAISGAPFGLVPPFVNQDVLTVDEQAAGSNVVQIIGGIPVEFTTSASS
jgi:hypothetical protein